MSRKIGISTFEFQARYGDVRALEMAKEAGADAVDFNVARYNADEDGIYSKSDDEIVAYFKGIRAKADEIGIEICQTHGRGYTFKNDPEYDANVLKNARLDCLATAAMGVEVCVMHGVTTCDFSPDVDPKFMHQLNFDFFTKALVFAKEYGVKIATETFGDAPNFGCCDFFGNTREFIISFNRISAVGDNSDYFTMCMDTGHCNKAMRFNNNPKPSDVIRLLGKNISVLHLHDNDTFTDQHKMPFTGCIDWNDVFDAFDEIGFEGVYNLEMVCERMGHEVGLDYARFAVTAFRNFLKNRYGAN